MLKKSHLGDGSIMKTKLYVKEKAWQHTVVSGNFDKICAVVLHVIASADL